ncbi:arylsulfatase [Streptomyces sp. NPDC005423]|uniref:arylsulfatase n=1 Tax=Streptomyces sp. NPDC005423 TaxID=3155343 RepID=UPI0033BCCE6D
MLALLHTSPVHVPVFDALRDEDHLGLELRHFVDEGLLARARREGPGAVADAVGELLAAGARGGPPVLRVDRPMAAAAVAAGPRVVVLATVESTLGPTAALVEEEGRRAGRPVDVRTVLVDGAWACFEAGDAGGCARLVAAGADAVTGADAIVLAQASMAPAQRLTTTALPVLSSPRAGLAAAARLARAHLGE